MEQRKKALEALNGNGESWTIPYATSVIRPTLDNNNTVRDTSYVIPTLHSHITSICAEMELLLVSQSNTSQSNPSHIPFPYLPFLHFSLAMSLMLSSIQPL